MLLDRLADSDLAGRGVVDDVEAGHVGHGDVVAIVGHCVEGLAGGDVGAARADGPFSALADLPAAGDLLVLCLRTVMLYGFAVK